jgi:hypothetical protein
MAAVAAVAMRRKAFTLLAAVAVVLVAIGGASAAELTHAEELAPEEDRGDREVGICVVGADSPCNGEETDGEQIATNNSEENKMWIPEDQNRDGEIDDRFAGDSSKELNGDDDSEESQIWIPEDQNRDGEIDDRFLGNSPDSLTAIISGILGLF